MGNKMIAEYVTEVFVTDPDTGLSVNVSIFKHPYGGMFGVDTSFIEQNFDDNEKIIVPDVFSYSNDADELITLTELIYE